jgi:hypothetical protein
MRPENNFLATHRWVSPMRYRKPRIAWSTFCGIACALLIVLWVRSYSDYAIINWNLDGDHVLRAMHHRGTVYAEHRHIKPYPMGRFFVQENWMTLLKLPYWFLAFTVAVFGSLPWFIQRPFTLRTLLIATTLVAVVLGMVVWSIR